MILFLLALLTQPVPEFLVIEAYVWRDFSLTVPARKPSGISVCLDVPVIRGTPQKVRVKHQDKIWDDDLHFTYIINDTVPQKQKVARYHTRNSKSPEWEVGSKVDVLVKLKLPDGHITDWISISQVEIKEVQ